MNYILITGASGGIGEAFAYRLAERKHNLILIARNEKKLKSLSEILIEKFQIEAKYIVADLSQPSSPQYIFEESKQRNITVHMLINNAGVGSSGEFIENDLMQELSLIQLNITSLIALTHLFLKEMKKRRSGIVLNVSSMMSFMPTPYMANYAASKVFVRSFSRALFQECRPYGIHIMLLVPGLTKTNFNNASGLSQEKADALNSDYQKAPHQTPEQVVSAALNALDKRKQYVVSGRLNGFLSKLLAFIPDKMIAGFMAKSYQQKIK